MSARIRELLRYFGHSWHIFDNETRQLVIVYLLFRPIIWCYSKRDYKY
jgi:hypothetical protein